MIIENIKRKLLKFWKVILFLFLAWFLIIIFYHFGLLTLWQSKIYDRFFIRKTPPPNIMIVAIDDESIGALGGWPLPRSAFAKTLAKMQSAKAIGIDVSFADPSNKGGADDWFLAEALKNNKSQIFLASQFDDRGGKIILPIAQLLNNSDSAYVNVILNQDGIVRTFKPKIEEQYSLPLALLQTEKNFPTNVTIDYHGPAKTFSYVSLIDVYNGLIPSTVFENKMVLIGATAPDLHDILQTPFGAMPGVEIHANNLATLQAGKFFNPISVGSLALLVLFFDILAIYIILRFKKIALMIFWLLGELFLIQLLSIVAFRYYLEIPNIYISVSFLLTSGFLILYQYFSESNEKKMIREMFQYYLMPEVINELVQNPEKLKLGGEKRKMTILFSDIRDFTTISEKLSPETLTNILNEYLTEMTNAVMENRGFVDKYIGDAVMAFWGAPLPNPNHTRDACLSVLKMSQKLRELNQGWQIKNLPALAIGVGINTGDMVVGNIGSSTRFNYTVIGDEVNFGSRLEGLNKIYGTECLLSESAKKEIESDKTFILRELDLVTVKGKTEPKLIFELITRPLNEKGIEALREFALGRTLYMKGDFKNAKNHFTKALTLNEDKPSKVFLERCTYLEQNPPTQWNGVYEFKTK